MTTGIPPSGIFNYSTSERHFWTVADLIEEIRENFSNLVKQRFPEDQFEGVMDALDEAIQEAQAELCKHLEIG